MLYVHFSDLLHTVTVYIQCSPVLSSNHGINMNIMQESAVTIDKYVLVIYTTTWGLYIIDSIIGKARITNDTVIFSIPLLLNSLSINECYIVFTTDHYSTTFIITSSIMSNYIMTINYIWCLVRRSQLCFTYT